MSRFPGFRQAAAVFFAERLVARRLVAALRREQLLELRVRLLLALAGVEVAKARAGDGATDAVVICDGGGGEEGGDGNAEGPGELHRLSRPIFARQQTL